MNKHKWKTENQRGTERREMKGEGGTEGREIKGEGSKYWKSGREMRREGK